ncbi:MAG: NAD(P)H-dependent oxidoreductase [Spirochaetales bacterium]|jgi:chromate reductase|nr:NAD(P)H-dependent oxidoreductase [Spirochaetales bacterium]
MKTIKTGVIAGSARKESYSRKTAVFISSLMPAGFEMKMVNIAHLPLYNQDYDDEGRPPREWADFRREVKSFDAFLFVTPEYNRSFPPVLKNALDIASRPFGENLWSGKPGALVGVSPGKLGGFGANHHLRQVLMFLNIPLMPQPEAYIGGAAALFDEKGDVVSAETKTFLEGFAASCAVWVKRFV